MKHEKCLTCSNIAAGKCSGPYYMAMDTKDLVEWLQKFLRLNGITNAELAERSSIPKGTIDGMKYRDDVRHNTVCELIKAAIESIGGRWGVYPCENAIFEDQKLEELKRQNAAQVEEIALYKTNVDALQERVSAQAEHIDMYKKIADNSQATVKSYRRSLWIISAILLASLVGFILYLIIGK